MSLWQQYLLTRNYLDALWRTVVLGCLQPVNWEYCFPPERWLKPAVQDLIAFYTVKAYSKERELLDAANH